MAHLGNYEIFFGGKAPAVRVQIARHRIEEIADRVLEHHRDWAAKYLPGKTLTDIAEEVGLLQADTEGVATAGLAQAFREILGSETYDQIARANQVNNSGGRRSVESKGLIPYEPREFALATELSSNPDYVHQTGNHQGKPCWNLITQAVNEQFFDGKPVRKTKRFRDEYNSSLRKQL